MERYPARVRIVEVAPRDGLQNERAAVPTDVKLAFIGRLAEAGLQEIEVTSFVRPDRVPQLADAEAVLAGLDLHGPVRYSALVPNERGLVRAVATGIRRIALFTAASDTFARKNIGMSVAESLERFAGVAADALAAGLSVRGYVSTAFVCPYEGEVAAARVTEATEALLTMGADEVSLGDTIGAAAPTDVERLLDLLLARVPGERLALHFHDTYGMAIANAVAALGMGIATLDSSAGGLGGCPFAPGASGNLATEDLVYLLDRMGIESGVDLRKVAAASFFIEPHLGHALPSRQLQRLRAGATGGG